MFPHLNVLELAVLLLCRFILVLCYIHTRMYNYTTHRVSNLPSVCAIDLPAPACAVSRLALQDYAELLAEKHQGAAVLPGDTPSPPGQPALSQGYNFRTVIPIILTSQVNGAWSRLGHVSKSNPGLSYLDSVETGWDPPVGFKLSFGKHCFKAQGAKDFHTTNTNNQRHLMSAHKSSASAVTLAKIYRYT